MVDDDDAIEEMEKEEDLASASSIKTSAVSALVDWDLHDSPGCLQEKSRLPDIL